MTFELYPSILGDSLSKGVTGYCNADDEKRRPSCDDVAIALLHQAGVRYTDYFNIDPYLLEGFQAPATARKPWLVEGLIASGDDVLIAAETGSGKSLLSLHLAWCMATGRPFFNRAVTPGRAVYWAAEAGRSHAARFEARAARDGRPERLMSFFEPADLLVPGVAARIGDRLGIVAKALNDPISVLVLDTLSRLTAGHDENQSATMSGYLDALREIRERAGIEASVTLHHTSRSSTDPRGHSALLSGMDVAFSVSRHPGGRFVARTKKLRDDEPGAEFDFAIDALPVNGATAPVLRELDTAAGERAAPVLSSKQRRALDILQEIAPNGSARAADWQEALVEAGVISRGNADSQRKATYRLGQELANAQFLAYDPDRSVYTLSADSWDK
jgi:hypothetical protein